MNQPYSGEESLDGERAVSRLKALGVEILPTRGNVALILDLI